MTHLLLAFAVAVGADQLKLPLGMLLVFGSAKLLDEIFERLKQPGIVGQILAGVTPFFARPNEASPWIYVIRLLALILILAAILRKNYGSPTRG